jgi:hypothetical protein
MLRPIAPLAGQNRLLGYPSPIQGARTHRSGPPHPRVPGWDNSTTATGTIGIGNRTEFPNPKADNLGHSARLSPLANPTVRWSSFMSRACVAVTYKALIRRRSHQPQLASKLVVPSMGFDPLRDTYLSSLRLAGSQLPTTHRCAVGVSSPKANHRIVDLTKAPNSLIPSQPSSPVN